MGNKIDTYTKITARADIKVKAFDITKRYTKPHRHNKYMELVYFSKGSGVHYMDLESYLIEPPILFLIKKDEVHHWEIDTIPAGFVIIIKEDFLRKSVDKNINGQLQKLNLRRKIVLQKDSTIDNLFQILCTEITKNGLGQNEIVEGVLKALLAKFMSYANFEGTSSLGDILTQFDELLGKELRNDVSFYARKLNTTAQNLSFLCKRNYSKTASQIIGTQIVMETKRLLRFTNLSVSEIAFKFHFKDVSHFVKFFKRHESKTPLQFKKTQ